MYVNKENNKISQYNVVQYNTTFNYELSNKHIIEFTHFRQCHQKLNIMSIVKI